ncbi:glycosyltransferase family 4 protein [Candidatus Parcubacteria bacterium]|nr:glycosyltransferase family 4 protein [Candidatus Parcubacteria bacterium]
MQKVKKIKICYVTNIDKSIKFILLNQLKFLKNEGYEIFAVCSNGKFIKDIEKQGIKIKIINFKRKISPIADLICLLKLFFYFKKEKFDIIHTHTPKPGLLGQLAAKFAGVPIIINTIHGFYFDENSSFFKRKFFIFIEKISAKCSNLIFFVNKEDMDTVAREKICNSDLIKYLSGGIDLSRFNLNRFSEEFILIKRKELGIGSEKKVIGIVARLVKEKGYLDLFEALKKVLRIFPETILLIIGPLEPEKKDAVNPDIIKNYDVEKNVLFLGEKEDVEKIYPLIDIFVLPSWREGLGVSILEASAMKKPVIATDIRGCREAVDDDKSGILVPLKNPESLSQAIIYLLRNPEKAKKMGEEGRKRAEKEFDERLVFGRIKTEYQRLIKEKL